MALIGFGMKCHRNGFVKSNLEVENIEISVFFPYSKCKKKQAKVKKY